MAEFIDKGVNCPFNMKSEEAIDDYNEGIIH